MVDTALLLVISPALFHTVFSVVVSVAKALVAEAHHVFLSVVVASHSFRLRILTLLSSRWHDTGLLLSVLTPVSGHLPAHFLPTEQDTRGLENIWLMDSGCSCHMTGSHRWFSSLTPTKDKEYIVFGDNSRGKVRGVGAIRISDDFTLREVALVDKLGFNLLSVSQLLDEGVEVSFKRGCSRVLDSRGDFVCGIVPFGRVFRIDFSGSSSSTSPCLVTCQSSEL